MEMYKKPVMEIVELEKVDVLTCSQWVNGVKCPNSLHSNHEQCKAANLTCHPTQSAEPLD